MTALRHRPREALAARESVAGDRLPYAHHVNDRTVALRDGSLMCVLRLDGFPFETADDAELDYRAGVRGTLLRSLGSSRFGLYSHVVRRRVAPYPDGCFDDPFARALDAAWKRRVTGASLFVNDLFASLGRMDAVVDRMPFLAGFGVRLLLVIQGLAQLDRLYGAAARELILQNAGLQVYFAANDEQTSAYVSNRLGRRTVVQKTRSRSASAFGQRGTITRGQALHARPLLTPDEVRRLGADEAILFVEGARPVRARKIVHYRDRQFVARLRAPSEVAPIEVPRHRPFVFKPAVAPPVTSTPAADPVVGASVAPARAPMPRRPRAKPAPTLDQLDFGRLLRGPEAPTAP